MKTPVKAEPSSNAEFSDDRKAAAKKEKEAMLHMAKVLARSWGVEPPIALRSTASGGSSLLEAVSMPAVPTPRRL